MESLLAPLGTSGLILTFKTFGVVLLSVLIEQQVSYFNGWDFSENFFQIVTSQTEVFDFIIGEKIDGAMDGGALLGGGSAGAVVANRLSAPPNNYKVLLLEAGGDQNVLTYFPVLDVFCANHPGIDWLYKSVPEQYACLSSKNRETSLNRGLGLGGSSNLNYLVYNRANRRDYDLWAQMTGDCSWSYDNVLPYFIKSENYNGNYPNAKIHGCGGLLNVDRGGIQKGKEYFLGALKDRGLYERDVNENQTNSFMLMEQTSSFGIRWSTFLGFIKPFLNRPNLSVYRYSHVTKLLFAPDKPNRVIGVEYIRHNVTTHLAYAGREVILSAGAYNSPKILMLSGIGPREELAKHGIPLVKELPVGQYLEDHPTTIVPFTFNTSGTSHVFERDAVWDFLGALRKPSRLGDMGTNNLLATGYSSSPVNDDPNWPDVQYHISYLGITALLASFLAPIVNSDLAIMHDYLAPIVSMDGNFALITAVRPKSIGSVRLRSANPNDPPIITNNFLSHPDDAQSLVHGLKFIVDFYEKSPSYQRIGAQLTPHPWPHCKHVPFRSDAYYECHARHVTFSLWHPVATCPMGKPGDFKAVVDSKLRVMGIKGLRVVDASVMPRIVNGNTNAPTIMIGEKAASDIIQHWGGINTIKGSQSVCNFP